jgi:hypothetical protein
MCDRWIRWDGSRGQAATLEWAFHDSPAFVDSPEGKPLGRTYCPDHVSVCAEQAIVDTLRVPMRVHALYVLLGSHQAWSFPVGVLGRRLSIALRNLRRDGFIDFDQSTKCWFVVN